MDFISRTDSDGKNDLAADFSVSNSPSTAYGGPPPLTHGRQTRPLLFFHYRLNFKPNSGTV